MDQVTVFQVVYAVLFWSSPVIFFVGVLLVLYGSYRNLELTLAKEIGGIRKKIFPKLENNIYTFHEWLLEKNTLVGLICVICALIFFFALR